MTEEEAKNNLVNFWREANFSNNYYIHQSDLEFFQKNNLFSITNKQKGINKDRVIYSSLLPEHYIGNLSKAKFYIINLNPGFCKNDFTTIKDKEFKESVLSCLYQKEMKGNKYPFYMLNPAFCDYSGPSYWQGKLKCLCDTIMTDKHINKNETIKFLSEKICDLELFPYHSKKFCMSYENIKDLPSVQRMIDFVKYNLIPRAQRNEIIVLITRQGAVWKKILGIKNKNIFILPSSYAQSAPIFPKTLSKGSPFKVINPKILNLLYE